MKTSYFLQNFVQHFIFFSLDVKQLFNKDRRKIKSEKIEAENIQEENICSIYFEYLSSFETNIDVSIFFFVVELSIFIPLKKAIKTIYNANK